VTTQLSDFLPYLLFQAAELTGRDFQKLYQDRYEMLRTEWRVLFHLGQTGDQTAKQICERASLHKTKVSRAVKALEQKRFLSRATLENDRRQEVLSLTKKGASVLAELTVMAADYDETFEKSLGAETLKTLVANLNILISTYQEPNKTVK
jgi:DNA-binding MarR family transcriptional regulator